MQDASFYLASPIKHAGLRSVAKSFVLFLLLGTAFLLFTGCRPEQTVSSELDGDTPTQKVQEKSVPSPPEKSLPVPQPQDAWPLWRGDASVTGFSPSRLAPPLKIGWEFELEGDAFENSPIVADSKVFVASSDGVLLALNLEDGKELWRRPTEIGFVASPSYRKGRLYIGDVDGRVYCFDANDGQPIWEFETEEEVTSAANFDSDRVLVASQAGTLHCLNAETGEKIWRYQSNDQLRCFPTIAEGRVLLGGCNGQLIAVSLDSGEQVESVELNAPTGSTAAVGGDVAFLGTEGKTFWAIDYLTGKVVWEYTSEKRAFPFRSSAAVTDSTIFVGSRDKRLHALDRATGQPAWLFNTKGRIDGSPIVLGDVVYFGSADERFYALDAKDGKELWRFELGGTVLGSAAFAKGRIIVNTDDGRVVCFVSIEGNNKH